MLKQNKSNIFFLCFLVSTALFSQTKEELKKQKQLVEEEIEYTNSLLEKIKSNKNKSLNYLMMLEKQIDNKNKLLQTLSTEIKLFSKQIKKTENQIKITENTIFIEQKNLEKLKKEYAKMIYAVFIKKGNQNDLMFIISARDFNQAYKRMTYLKQYTSFRKNQSEKIEQTEQVLSKEKEELLIQKKQLIEGAKLKETLVATKKKELILIKNANEEKQELLNKLTQSEKKFKKQQKNQQQKATELENKIRKIIEEEIRKSREELGKKEGNNNYSLTPEALALSSKFVANKGALPWPLTKGIIVRDYGKQKHAVFSGVETFNNGIDIATDKNTIVRAVFDGKISRIFFIKGEGKAVLITHGEYFTVYSGLKEVSVKLGDNVLAKEKIGVVITQEAEHKTELHFEIWKGYDKEDPSKWLFRAN